jgi:putative transposase
MQTVEKQFESNGKSPKTIEWLTDNGSNFTATETRSLAEVYNNTCDKPSK